MIFIIMEIEKSTGNNFLLTDKTCLKSTLVHIHLLMLLKAAYILRNNRVLAQNGSICRMYKRLYEHAVVRTHETVHCLQLWPQGPPTIRFFLPAVTPPLGRSLVTIIIGTNLRGEGELERRGGGKVVVLPDTYSLVSFDRSLGPGLPAFLGTLILCIFAAVSSFLNGISSNSSSIEHTTLHIMPQYCFIQVL